MFAFFALDIYHALQPMLCTKASFSLPLKVEVGLSYAPSLLTFLVKHVNHPIELVLGAKPRFGLSLKVARWNGGAKVDYGVPIMRREYVNAYGFQITAVAQTLASLP